MKKLLTNVAVSIATVVVIGVAFEATDYLIKKVKNKKSDDDEKKDD